MTAFGFCDSFAFGIYQGVDYLHLLFGGVHIVYLHLTIVHEDSPVLDVDGMRLGEPHVAVDATTRIPA